MTTRKYQSDPLAKPASKPSPAATAGVNKVGKTTGKFSTTREGAAQGKGTNKPR